MERFFASKMRGSKLLSLIETGRPWNGLAAAMTGTIGFLLAATSISPVSIATMFFSILCIFLAGTTVNDLADAKIDKINMPYRPIQQKRISKKEAALFMGLMYLAGLSISLLASHKFFLMMFVFAISTLLYSLPPLAFEKRSFLAQIYLSFVSFLIPAYSGAVLALDSYVLPADMFSAFAAFTALYAFVVIIKDYKDVKGDKASGKFTFILHVGEKTATRIMITGTLIAFPLTIIQFYRIFGNPIFAIVSVVPFLNLLNIQTNIKNPEKAFGNARLSILAFLLIVLFFSIQTQTSH